jgi:hypothetical protein
MGWCSSTRCTSPHRLHQRRRVGLIHDYDEWLERLAPHAPTSQYHTTAPARTTPTPTEAQIMGREVVVAITDGKLDLGRGSRSSTPSSMEGGRSASREDHWRMTIV